MINCLDCKYYSSNPYLRCAVNPTALGGCEMGEVGEPLNTDEPQFPTWPPQLYVDWHNGERINVNELTGIDRDLVLMGVPVDELEETKRTVEYLFNNTRASYQEALSLVGTYGPIGARVTQARHSISFLGAGASVVDSLNNLGRLP